MTERPIVIARLHARLQPLDRGSLYEDPIDAALREAGVGAVTGGGTLQDATGEIELCDIEVELADSSERSLELVRELLERLGAGKAPQRRLSTRTGLRSRRCATR